MLKFLRVIVFFLPALTLYFGATVSRADTAPSEPQMKAAFILNFPKYVEWPPATLASPSSPILVAILGDDAVANELAAMSEGKSVDGHPIQLLRNPTIAQCLGCHILFIGAAEPRRTAEIVGQLKSSSVLTVGESDQFIDQGGMINLALRERRIVLEVNLKATKQTELHISSKLMALARVKGEKK